MIDDAAGFTGTIPEHYDRGLGPIIFVDYATEMAKRVAAGNPTRVLETAAGTGIVTRRLRDALPPGVGLTATDLNAPMLEIARTKFRPGEEVEFQPADAMALPFPDGGFDAVVCQFGIMFFPDRKKSYHEVHRVLAPGGRYLFSVWDAHRYNPFGRSRKRSGLASSPSIRRSSTPCRSPAIASIPSGTPSRTRVLPTSRQQWSGSTRRSRTPPPSRAAQLLPA